MSALRSPSKLGRRGAAVSRGHRRLRRTNGALGAAEPLVRPGALESQAWKVAALVGGVLALAFLGLLLTLMPDEPETEPPEVAAPSISAPSLKPTVPAPSLDAPKVGTPNLEPPQVGVPSASLPTPSLPDNDSSSPNVPAGPERRTEVVHDHHRTYLWYLDLLPLLLAFGGLVALYPFARLPRPDQHVLGGALAVGLIGFSVAMFASGIEARPGAGTYEREPPEIERSGGGFFDSEPETIVRHIHIHHRHEPIDVYAHWLLVGLGLAALAVPGARVATEPAREQVLTRLHALRKQPTAKGSAKA
jgi:hypothetical protein